VSGFSDNFESGTFSLLVADTIDVYADINTFEMDFFVVVKEGTQM